MIMIFPSVDAQNEPAAVTITLTLATEEEEISEPSTMSESSGGEANSTGTGDESTTQTVSMVQRQDDSLIIIIEASVASGGFIAILVFVSACISVILIRRHRKAHAHYYSQPTRRRYCNSVELEQNGSNFNETSLQDNAAYNRGQPTNRNDEQESNNNKWPNQAHLSWTETYEEVDLASEQYETMPDNSAYSECGSISSNYNSLETFNSSLAYMQAHDKRKESVLTNAGLNEHEVVWLKQKGTRSMENEASRWRESTSEMYDVVDRKSEAYESIDYRDARWMKMSKNMAYACSTQVEREAQIEHSLQERNDYEHQYEHIQ